MHTAYLLLGGNMGNREKMLDRALFELGKTGRIVAVSVKKETEPWGFETPVASFLNQAVCLETLLDPETLMGKCLEIEERLGRTRKDRGGFSFAVRTYEPRLIDIDILLYDKLKHQSPRLVIPHPRLRERPFAVELLEEILPKNLSLEDFY